MAPPYHILDWYGGCHTCHTASGATGWWWWWQLSRYPGKKSREKCADCDWLLFVTWQKLTSAKTIRYVSPAQNASMRCVHISVSASLASVATPPVKVHSFKLFLPHSRINHHLFIYFYFLFGSDMAILYCRMTNCNTRLWLVKIRSRAVRHNWVLKHTTRKPRPPERQFDMTVQKLKLMSHAAWLCET